MEMEAIRGLRDLEPPDTHVSEVDDPRLVRPEGFLETPPYPALIPFSEPGQVYPHTLEIEGRGEIPIRRVRLTQPGRRHGGRRRVDRPSFGDDRCLPACFLPENVSLFFDHAQVRDERVAP